jgi:protoheme IX farnesyltransferase
MSTVSQTLPPISSSRVSTLLRDYAELTKLRVTTLVVLTAWCGYYFACVKSGVSSVSWGLLHALLGVGMVSGGTAALNEVIECEIDAKMRRTARRPLPSGRMSLLHGTLAGLALTIGGAFYLGAALDVLTGWLSLVTALVYLVAYTPLKRISPVCTTVGAIPGAMPAVLGWTAVRGRIEWEALVLFAILFLWQFPHFFSIAWLYREDYASGGIRMLPVVETEGRATARRIILYSIALIPISLLPGFLGMAGRLYIVGAVLLGLGLLYVGMRLATLQEPVAAAQSKRRARQLLQASVLYLPLLFALMMVNSLSS